MQEVVDSMILLAPAMLVEFTYGLIDLLQHIAEWIGEQLGHYTYS